MIKIDSISKKYDNLNLFEKFSLDIPQGKVVCFFGESGCGKTTLLNMIAGTVEPDQGEIVTDSLVSYIFQEPRLLPWETVVENVKLVIKDEKEKDNIAKKYIELVGLTQYQGYYPKELSGGMKQRVAIARAFAYNSNIILMDEPFKGLDEKLKINLMNSLKKIFQKEDSTIVFVTHDFSEATYLADIIYKLEGKPLKITETIEKAGDEK